MQAPRHFHLVVVPRIFSICMGMLLPSVSPITLAGYTDIEWAMCMDTWCSVTGLCMFPGDALIFW